MTMTEMVVALDAEISRLRQVRELLAGTAQGSQQAKVKGSRVASGTTAAVSAEGAGRKKRTLSPEARERIASAQRARWAAHTAAKPVGDGGSAPKRGRGRPKKDGGAKRTDAGKQEGAEGTA